MMDNADVKWKNKKKEQRRKRRKRESGVDAWIYTRQHFA